jgi:prevent-host-death family protein
MDVSVRELRNHTGRVVAAVEAGEAVVLTVHGRPVADILPRRVRSERRPSDLLLSDLRAIDELAGELRVSSDAADFDIGWTTDDMLP